MLIDEFLFDNRIIVGKSLETLIVENDLKKAMVCKNAGISRPTLYRMLRGEVTSKAYFTSHLYKILQTLQISADDFISMLKCRQNAQEAFEEEILEFRTTSGERALFRASIGIVDPLSGEIRWQPVKELEIEKKLVVRTPEEEIKLLACQEFDSR